FAQGKGNKEQQFYLWFDPTSDFHTYTIVWNPPRLIFMVDNIALRVHNNLESMGVPFPSKQPMKFYSSLRNAGLQNGAWQTQGLDAAGRNRLR
ncbi:Xyloglucan endotransglucosylase protein 1, partial [Linum perenne]